MDPVKVDLSEPPVVLVDDIGLFRKPDIGLLLKGVRLMKFPPPLLFPFPFPFPKPDLPLPLPLFPSPLGLR